jgi:DNA polymerase-3 subunit epsilon/ATP-dependent DNA helicase DinG
VPAAENVDTIMRGVQRGLDELNSVVLNLADSNLPDYDMLQAQTTKLWRFATEFVQNMAIFMTGSDENAITWMNYQRNRNILTVALNPLEVATLLRERLFDKKASVVLTSATLSVNGGYDYMRNRLGIPVANELLLDSPYNYEQQAVVYIPQDMPDIKDYDYQSTMEEAIFATGMAASGRTLVLFTATSALRNTYHALLERFNEHDINLIGQGIDGSNKVILERFKSEPRSVLFGTASFWEGVDVAGDALSALVITKLPFAVPTDPIYAARAEQFSDAFREYSIPQSILKFKQGFGRLVRAQDDCGVVVVLDKRLVTKRYGEQFLQSLPPTTVRTGPVAAIASLVRRRVRPLANQSDGPVAP